MGSLQADAIYAPLTESHFDRYRKLFHISEICGVLADRDGLSKCERIKGKGLGFSDELYA
jgi:hypothetical protein